MLAATLWFSLTAPYGLELRDEGRILVRSERVLEKALPNADFSDVYGPGVSLLNALVLALSDRSVAAVRWTVVAVKVIAVGAICLSASAVANAPITAGATAFAILTFGRASWNVNAPYAALYVLAFGMVALALLLRGRITGGAWLAGAAGFAVGAALIFKHSLAAMYAVSLALGLALSMLLEPRGPQTRAQRGILSAIFTALLMLPLLVHVFPFAFVGPRQYLLFFAPAHALGVLVLMAAWRRPGGGRGRVGVRALIAAGVGLALVPLAVAGFYAWRGALHGALSDLSRWPQVLVNYAADFALPSVADVTLLTFVVAVSLAGLLGLAGRARAAMVAAAVALLLFVLGLTADGWIWAILPEADVWRYALPSLLGYALLAVCGTTLLSGRRPPWLVPALIVAFFHHATGFQIFPRASLNTIMTMPILAPSMAVVAAFASRRLRLTALDRRRRAAAYALLALPAVVLALPALSGVVELRRAATLPIPFPETRGLSIRADAATDVLSMREVLTYMEGRPDSPLLLLNNDAMLIFLSRRPSLVPELDLPLQLMGDGMLGSRSVKLALLFSRIQAEPDPLVVIKDDHTTEALRTQLPGLFDHLELRFEPAFTAGPYTVLRRAAKRGRGPLTRPRPAPPA
jgi:hypothetical protein